MTTAVGRSDTNAPLPLVRTLSQLGQKLVVLIPSAMALGLLVGWLVDLSPLKGVVLVMTMLMVYPMMVNFRPQDAFSREDGKPITIAMALNFVVLPGVAWGVASLFFRSEPELFVGMILAGLFPTSGMTISWTGFAKGNLRAAVKMTVIGLLLASVLAPLYLKLLAGEVVDVDMIEVLRTVVFVVAVPMAAGYATRVGLTRKLGPAGFKRIAPAFPGLSTVGVLGIVFLAMGLKAKLIIDRPSLVLWILVPLIGFYALNYAIAVVVGKAVLQRADAIAVVYGTVMRNLSIALGLAMASFGSQAALVLATAFVIQVQSAAWSVRFTDRFFGAAPAPTAP